MRSIYLQSFMLISFVLLELCPGQSLKCKNEQTPKLGNTELWFFYNILLLNEIYLPTKFYVDISYSFRVIKYQVKHLKWKNLQKDNITNRNSE
jgi:hypothetical protein